MDSKLHILHIGLYPPPYGGVSTHLYRLKGYLDRKGFKCSVIDWSGAHHHEKKKDNNVHLVGGSPFSIWFNILRIIKKNSPDIVHLHISSGSRLIWVALPLFLIDNSKKAVTIHSSAFFKKAGSNQKIILKILSKFDYIIAVNESISSYLKGKIKTKNPIEVIPAFVPPSEGEYSSPDEKIVNRLDRLKSRYSKILIIAGYLQESYGFELALKILERLDKRHALIMVSYTQTDNEYLEKIRPRMEKLEEQVEWFENLPPKDFLYLLSKSDILLRPQDLDGDSIVVREALHLNLNVFASDGSPRPEGVRLFKLSDPEGLIELIISAPDKNSSLRADSEATNFAENIYKLYMKN